MILAIVGLEHHVALVALEGLLDVVDAERQFLFPCPFFGLDRVRPVIKRQQEKIYDKTQREDARTTASQNGECCIIYSFEKKRQRR